MSKIVNPENPKDKMVVVNNIVRSLRHDISWPIFNMVLYKCFSKHVFDGDVDDDTLKKIRNALKKENKGTNLPIR